MAVITQYDPIEVNKNLKQKKETKRTDKSVFNGTDEREIGFLGTFATPKEPKMRGSFGVGLSMVGARLTDGRWPSEAS
jgi:hypothetical protein